MILIYHCPDNLKCEFLIYLSSHFIFFLFLNFKVDWSDPWFSGLLAFHLTLFGITFLTRNQQTLQAIHFVIMCEWQSFSFKALMVMF